MESASRDEHHVLKLCVNKTLENTSPLGSTSATWNFVQMNMTLLPIARPLPVSVSHRFQEGAVLVGVKPSTPTQKLHHRVRQHTTNMSPRRHDQDCNNGRLTASTLARSSSRGLPPTPRSARGAKRKCSETWHVSAVDALMLPPPAVASASIRMRSMSEDISTPVSRRDSNYLRDPARQVPSGSSPLDPSARLFSGYAATLYKGKRILELQDEDRRFYPDDRGMALLPSKRSKHQP